MRYILGIAILFSLVLNREIPVYASQIGDKDLIASNDSILNDYDFDGIDESLAQIFPQEKLDFKDSADISDYAVNAVSKLYEKGIVTGFSDGTFRPKEVCTRAQAAKMLYGAIIYNN